MIDALPASMQPLTDPPALVQRSNVLPGRHTPPTLECFVREADRNGLDPYVLLAVMKTENGRPGEVARNSNGTQDLGIMSINTVWIPELARRLGRSETSVALTLASDGCANVAAGAWILKQKIVEAGSVWEGVARFHSRNPAKQGPYLRRVYWRFKETVERVGAGAGLR
jgi:hypothetical protein